jgi:DNA-binding response OmpR family regulator
MSQVSIKEQAEVRPSATTSILLYSDNAVVRREVRQAVGETIGPRDTPIEWTEVATSEIAMDLTAGQHYDLVIGDNETTKLGGAGLTRQMRNELDWQPTVLLLLARQQDAWLAAWSGADAAMQQPVDPFALRARVAELLGIDDA